MRLPVFFALLGLLLAVGSYASNSKTHVSNLTYFGAPRFSIEGVLPVFEIAESYIRSQSDDSSKHIGFKGEGSCSASNPCVLGSCCNSNGQCGYSAEHCSPSSPKTCVANCDAKAACGKFSADGKTICPLNTCCSRLGFCGTSDLFCRDTTASTGDTPCLGGKCGAIDVPSCGKGSGSASRRIAYYQSWNTRRRNCDKVLPNQLDLSGITHLVLAFATINPKTFQVSMMNPADDDIYKQFMALPDSVSKWIGLGGFEFTDPGPTQHTWSDMTSTKENRKTFINSLKDFCSEWKFRGVDIDWEWPGHESRGGRAQDGANQVELVKDLRQAFSPDFGIGVAIPAQYDYMKNMDPKGLEAHVDWLTMLTYDLHGPWDMFVPGLGSKVKPHTDLKEIDEAFKLLWSSNIDSTKVNMGIANYGRGYTVADKNCMYYGCTFTGPSKAGSCSLQDGVLSTCEIRRLISENHLSWKVIAGGAEVNEVSWDDQWVAFDDAGTFGKKLELANDRCLGGTALWAIDYATCPSDGGSPQPGPGPDSSVVPSQSASMPASSIASSSSTAVPSSQAPGPAPSGTSMPVSSQVPSSTPSSAFSTSWQGSASPTSAVSSFHAPSSAPLSLVPPPSGAPSSVQTPPDVSSRPAPSPSLSLSASPPGSWSTQSSSVVWVSSAQSQSSSVAQSSTAPTLQDSSVASSSGSSPSTDVAPSSPASGSNVPTPSVSSKASSAWTSPQTGWSSQDPSTAQSSSSMPWSSSVIAAPSSSAAWSSTNAASSALPSSTPGSPSEFWSSSDFVPTASVITSSETLSSPASSFSTTWSQSASGSSPEKSSGASSSVQPTSQIGSSDVTITTPSSSQTTSSRGAATTTQPSSEPGGSSGALVSTALSSRTVGLSGGFTTSSSSDARSSGQFIATSPSQAISSWASSASEPTSQPGSSGQSVATSGSSSAAQSSAAQSSKPADSSAVSKTAADPPSSQVQTTTANPSSSVIPPPSQLWCPNECYGQDWCKYWCGRVLEWPPPRDCWDYEWCVLWWGFPLIKKDHDDKDPKKCKLLGCGCGWMGLPWGPGCSGKDLHFPFPLNIIIDIFGLFPEPCLFFGCDGLCGFLGCDKWCFGIEGCTPCPELLCPHGGPKPGPPPSPFPPIKPPGPTGKDGKPTPCEPKDYKTATERFVFCGEFVSLSSAISATTISSSASTTVSTSTTSSSTCHTPLEVTLVGCNVKDSLSTTTTSVTKSNSLSSETPGPACTRAPLSLDDDEGNNIPIDWGSSSSVFGSNTTDFSTPTSTSGPTPTADCGKCWKYFDSTCIPQRCKPDDPTWCAFRCLSDMCLAPNSPKGCRIKEECAHKACPTDVMGPPQGNVTLTLTFSSATSTVTMPSGSTFSTSSTSSSFKISTSFEVGTSTSSLEIGTSDVVIPTPGPMDKNGEWKVTVHLWMENTAAKIEWELFDPNKNWAGTGKMMPVSGSNSIFTSIESAGGRAPQHAMPFAVKAWYNDPISINEARVEFEIQKDMPNCDKMKGVPCKPKLITENKLETKQFFVDSCWQYCSKDKPEDKRLLPSDLGCDDMNDADWFKDGNAWRRDFNCYWHGF